MCQLAAAEPETYCVVVSPDVPYTDLASSELIRIFRFERRHWKSGAPVKVIFTEDSLKTGSFLLDEIYGTDYPAVKRMILEKLYSDEIDLPPKVVATNDATLAFIRSGSGLIAIVPKDSVGERPVRVLTIDGQAPGADGYPLRR